MSHHTSLNLSYLGTSRPNKASGTHEHSVSMSVNKILSMLRIVQNVHVHGFIININGKISQ
jgi:hypothetical protein